MNKLKLFALVAICAALTTVSARAATSTATMAPAPAPKATPAPTAAPAASATETKFIDAATKDLQARFATTAAATAAGYYRYNNEDQTGAISWVNTAYWKSDPQHPCQLWYDVNGRLIGADFSVWKATSPKQPSVWGVSPSRWLDFPAHIHFGVKTPAGVQFGYAMPKTWTTIGGSMDHPAAADVVKLATLPQWKKLEIPAPRDPDQVAFVFQAPSIWDLQIWLVPNPLGAFAEHNPNVKPSAKAEKQD